MESNSGFKNKQSKFVWNNGKKHDQNGSSMKAKYAKINEKGLSCSSNNMLPLSCFIANLSKLKNQINGMEFSKTC